MLTPADERFRALVKEMDGDAQAISAAIGISPTAVWKRLGTQKHREWWKVFKAARTKRRRNARQQRWRHGVIAKQQVYREKQQAEIDVKVYALTGQWPQR